MRREWKNEFCSHQHYRTSGVFPFSSEVRTVYLPMPEQILVFELYMMLQVSEPRDQIMILIGSNMYVLLSFITDWQHVFGCLSKTWSTCSHPTFDAVEKLKMKTKVTFCNIYFFPWTYRHDAKRKRLHVPAAPSKLLFHPQPKVLWWFLLLSLPFNCALSPSNIQRHWSHTNRLYGIIRTDGPSSCLNLVRNHFLFLLLSTLLLCLGHDLQLLACNLSKYEPNKSSVLALFSGLKSGSLSGNLWATFKKQYKVIKATKWCMNTHRNSIEMGLYCWHWLKNWEFVRYKAH